MLTSIAYYHFICHYSPTLGTAPSLPQVMPVSGEHGKALLGPALAQPHEKATYEVATHGCYRECQFLNVCLALVSLFSFLHITFQPFHQLSTCAHSPDEVHHDLPGRSGHINALHLQNDVIHFNASLVGREA